MSDFFTSPFSIPIVAIVCAVGIPILAKTWGDWAKHQETCRLKESMIQRGMSVDEIERVMAAGDSKSTDCRL
ncbi:MULTISPECIES: hypothetical protein [Crateriforma]|uniref:Uncharacterized protein n=1 Tax=Crateriforma conspicua TaxID=2527996 RepID=A0A5C6G210_9PLAN|nr:MULTISPECIES: hypothetical protein [Crateriforma]QDV63458.1 hypothetical protein Mal65_26010 [Crateriforma conspicua]TWT67770.1 hypothetical protein Pan14r_00070 [Crateriforma conspicua]TWU67213.1 hypothetical protein V7x_27860 [Crateriforma conspicua]